MTRDACRARVLAAMPGTPREIAARALVSDSTCRLWIRRLRADGQCHISKWTRTSGHPVPTHTPGGGKDAKCFPPLTMAEWCRKSRQRAELDGRADILRARRVAKRTAKRAATTPNTWLSALMGVQP